jgi:hypothetical protein
MPQPADLLHIIERNQRICKNDDGNRFRACGLDGCEEGWMIGKDPRNGSRMVLGRCRCFKDYVATGWLESSL